MFKSSSLALYLYITLISIFFTRNQNTNKLIVLNDKPFPVFLSHYKNETHYFIITSGEYLCIEIKTGNIERISAESDTYKYYCVFFTDPSNNNYMYCEYYPGILQIIGIIPKFVRPNYQFSFASPPSIIGSMEDINDAILYGYRPNMIYFLYIINRISANIIASLKKLTSCKILKNYQKYLCACNSNYDKIDLYVISYYSHSLHSDKYYSSIPELNGYIDGYLYDTLNLTNKILCAKQKDNIEVNCWLYNISLTDFSYELNKLSEISFETYNYRENDCYLDNINSTYLFCCGRINGLTCFQMDLNFNMIKKDELNINGNISYVSIINEENILNIIFMNTIIINENKNNYISYMYDFSNFSFISENITDTNFETNRSTKKEEISDFIEYVKTNYYKTEVNNGVDFELKDNKILYTLTNLLNQKNNLNKNKTTIDLEECANVLKSQVYTNISKDADLYIIKIDIQEEGMKIPKIEYGLFYPLYGGELIELNMAKCEGMDIDISIPVSINDDINMHNASSDYYNNKCSKGTSKDGTDITLNDRKNEFVNNNMTLCEEDCDLIEYSKNPEKVKCNCKIKLNIPIIQTVKFDKKKLFQHFTDINKVINIEILKCYKNVFKFKNLIKNYGFFFYSLMLLIYLVILFIFYLKSFSILKNNIKMLVKDMIFIFEKNKKDSKKLIYDNKSINSKNLSTKNIVNKKRSKRKRKKDKNFDNNKIIKKNNLIDNEIKNRNKNGKNINKKKIKFNLENLNANDSPMNQNILNKYNDTELNKLKYEDALLKDKRTYCQYFFSLLKKEHLLIFSFYCNDNDYNSQIIKIFLFFFYFSMNLFVNALFFDDDTIHRIYEDKGDFNFIYQLPQIIYSSLISDAINIIIKFLSLSEEGILKLKGIRKIKILNSEFLKFLRTLNIKFALFFVITFCMLIIFLYYVTIFCGVYANSQIHLFDDSIISFGTSFLYEFGIYLIPGIFRMIALRTKDKSCLYGFSQFLENL